MSCFDCKKMHPKCKAECCGVVPIPKDIYEANMHKIVNTPSEVMKDGDHVIPITSNANCIYLNNNDLSCNIYEIRPDICRKFGDESHPMLFCPYLDKKGKERSRQNRRQTQRQSQNFLSKLRVFNEN